MATRTAVVAGTATAVSGRVSRRQAARYDQKAEAQAYEQQQYAQQQAPPQQYAPAPEPAPAAAPQDETTASLENLARLHQQGVLSDAEFAAAKAKVLGI
ncbi:MAG TPA: SHOCT domain-containing protein [Jatrophihabitantaceae bacterium]